MAKFKIYDINSKDMIAEYDKTNDNYKSKELDTLFINGEFYKPVDIGYNFDNGDFILIVQKKSAKFKFAYEKNVKNLFIIGSLSIHFRNTLPYSTYGLNRDDIKNCYNLVEDGCTLEAIKYVKEETGIGLKEAKEFIDEFVIQLKNYKLKEYLNNSEN